MKTSAAVSVLALATSAVAVNFEATAVHSGDSRVHQQQINAQKNAFWIGRPTETFCPDTTEKAGGCPEGPNNTTDVTVFVGPAAGQSSVNFDVAVPGGQIVYVDPEDGHLAFSTAHAGPPLDAVTTGFTYTPNPSQGGSEEQGSLVIPGFTYTPNPSQGGSEEQGSLVIPGSSTACPDPAGGYQVFSSDFYKGRVDRAQCIGIGLATLQTTDESAAWQYV